MDSLCGSTEAEGLSVGVRKGYRVGERGRGGTGVCVLTQGYRECVLVCWIVVCTDESYLDANCGSDFEG